MNNAKHASLMEIYRTMLAAAGTQAPVLRRHLMLLVVTAAVQGVTFAVFIPLMLAVGAGDTMTVYRCLWAITALIGISSVLRWRAQEYDYGGYAAHAGDELRRSLGVHLRRMPLEELYTCRSGELNALLAGTVDEVINYTMSVSTMLINAVVTPLLFALTVMWFDWRIGLVLLLTFPLILPLYRQAQPLLARGKKETAAALSRLNAETVEYTQGLPVLKSANSVGAASVRLNRAVHDVERVQNRAVKREALPNLLLGSAVEIGMVLVLLIGMMWVEAGSLSVWLLAAVMVAAVRFAEPLSIFLSMMSIYEMMQGGYQRLRQLQAIAPLPQQSPVAIPQHFDILFAQLHFHYRGAEQSALRDINLNIPERAMTALVGASGCGKTTLARMLMRYADPQQGSVTIGGVDVRHIPQEKLMSLIAAVFQDVYLFDDSILNNIRMGRADASDEEVFAAARAAQCHDFIQRLPENYHTRVGEIGGQLSGGEKQRISIARALLKNAPIVILDEPTAALDTESEVAVQRAINTLVRNKTVIVIAHRLSTIVGAAQIVVMKEGGIVEIGDHDALLAQNGHYAALWSLQQGSATTLRDMNTP